MIPIDMPDAVKRADGSARFAYVTFVMMNDSYVPGALLLAYGLRRQWTEADIVCLVTPEVTADARDALAVLYDHVVEVETVCVPHKRSHQRRDRPFWFTRQNALRLGADGDLGPILREDRGPRRRCAAVEVVRSSLYARRAFRGLKREQGALH